MGSVTSLDFFEPNVSRAGAMPRRRLRVHPWSSSYPPPRLSSPVTDAPGSRRSPATRRRGLSGMTPGGRAVVPASWALYDFANTIFSFAVVSGAIGLYLVSDDQFGERDGNAVLLAIVVSVGINALVSPILGAFRSWDRRMPFLLFFTVLWSCRRSSSARSGRARGRAVHVANFAYQAALIYYDATLKVVSYPRRAASCRGSAPGSVLRHGLRRAPDRRPRRAGRGPVPVDGHPARPLRHPIFLFVREPRDPGVKAVTAAESATRSGSSSGPSRTPARCPAWCVSCSAGSSIPMR